MRESPFTSDFGVFGLRGVYFALREETRIPNDRTGTAVGLISVGGCGADRRLGRLRGPIRPASEVAPRATGL
jgi:hypothetical protein